MQDQRDGENKNAGKPGDEGNQPSCGPACGCGFTGVSKKVKVIVCLIVGLAVMVVLARGFLRRAATEAARTREVFTTVLPVVKTDFALPANVIAMAIGENKWKDPLWGDPLDSLNSLNKVAVQKDAVFVFLPTGNKESEETARKEIETAASKIMSGGMTMAAYILKKDTRDYAKVTSQIPAPCVLAIVQGRGMGIANKITEVDLIQALVMASRSSSCESSASSCSPSDCQ